MVMGGAIFNSGCEVAVGLPDTETAKGIHPHDGYVVDEDMTVPSGSPAAASLNNISEISDTNNTRPLAVVFHTDQFHVGG